LFLNGIVLDVLKLVNGCAVNFKPLRQRQPFGLGEDFLHRSSNFLLVGDAPQVDIDVIGTQSTQRWLILDVGVAAELICRRSFWRLEVVFTVKSSKSFDTIF
jgi:hypothetical protein